MCTECTPSAYTVYLYIICTCTQCTLCTQEVSETNLVIDCDNFGHKYSDTLSSLHDHTNQPFVCVVETQ